jgi:hypothetical protein
MFGQCMEAYFSASVFLRLCRDDQGAVALLPLFNYIMRRNAMLQAVGLSAISQSMHPPNSPLAQVLTGHPNF